MDAIGVAVFSIGGFLLYASIKGEHPWSLFTKTLGASSGSSGSSPNSVAGSAPYTGPLNSQGLGQGVSLAGGGTGALHG